MTLWLFMMIQLPTKLSHVYLETPDRQYYVSVDIETMRHNQTLLAYNNLGVCRLMTCVVPLCVWQHR